MEAVKKLRKRRGWTIQELADASGTSHFTVNEIELGKRSPRGSTLQKIAKALDVPVSALFNEEPADPKAQAPSQQLDIDAAALGQEEDEDDDRLMMRQQYERAFSGAHDKLRSDLASLDLTDPKNSDSLFALWTLASVSAMQAYALTENEPFLQEGEGETVAERRALRGFLEAADSLSETADEIAEVIEIKGTQDSGILYVLDDARRRKRAS